MSGVLSCCHLVARPEKPIDPEKVERLGGMGLSAELIGAVLDVDHRTSERRFAPVLKKGRTHAQDRLRSDSNFRNGPGEFDRVLMILACSSYHWS
jgi:hypothetical protein